MSFSLKLFRNDISPAISALVHQARNPTAVLRSMGTTFKSITEGNFNSAGASYRPKPWPAKRDGTPSNLQQSTTLAKSFALEVTSTYAKVSNPMIYAAIHQFGGVIKPKSGKFLVFTTADGHTVFVRSVKIPARPFFPVLDGKLTPAAEELIARAGQRTLARESGAV
jgi:phage gpG-like protein